MVSTLKFQQKRNREIMTESITREEAIAALQQERDVRIKECNLEIQASLEKYHCVLKAEPVIQNGVIVTVMHLLSND
jgi:hypothetical protein